MTRFEKKIISFVEKNLIFLIVLLLTVLALFVRRQGIWYYSQDYIHYFDMHENNIQSAVYYLIVRLMGYVVSIPLHGMKWLAGLADFVVACVCVLLYKRAVRQHNIVTTHAAYKSLLLYAGCLFAPVMYIRGCIWAQMDSLAFSFVLGALYMAQSNRRWKRVCAILLAAIGVAVYPILTVVVLLYFVYENRVIKKKSIVTMAMILLCAMILNGICGLLNAMTWEQGVKSFVNWMTYHPFTGQYYTDVKSWLWNMFLMNGYGIALVGGLLALCKKIPYVIGVMIQLVIAVCYASALGW